MIRKNKKFIDPRYFMDEKMELGKQPQQIIKEELAEAHGGAKGPFPGRYGDAHKKSDMGPPQMDIENAPDLDMDSPQVDIENALDLLQNAGPGTTFQVIEALHAAIKKLERQEEEPRDPYADESPYDAGY
jgi:hypothetical protein